MNYLKQNMIAELKQKKELDKLYRQNTIDLNNYFAYSGKQERKKKFVDHVNEYKFKKRIIINNDMSKYVLKKDKQSLTKIK